MTISSSDVTTKVGVTVKFDEDLPHGPYATPAGATAMIVSVHPSSTVADIKTAMETEAEHQLANQQHTLRQPGSKIGCKCNGVNHTCTFGPFSAVSTPQLARVGSFFSICQDLSNLHCFALLQPRTFRQDSSFFKYCFAKKIVQNL